MISVIIPLYNKESSISKTLKSVFNQSFEKFEVIVVNDGSTDSSLDKVKNFVDERLRIINKKNGGVSSARNRGILESKYQYLAFLDADDLWMNNHLEIINYMIIKYKKKNVNVLGTSFLKNKFKKIDLEKTESFIGNDFLIENYFIYASKPQSLFNSSSFAVKKSFAISKGMFDERLKYMEDVEFWYRLLKKSKLAYCKTVTSIYNTAAENRSDKSILPLQYRFHIFDYKRSDKFEKRYFDKLVSLILLDYFKLKAYRICFLVFLKYWYRLPFILNYYKKLFLKRIVNV
jgi:glycosyltransferase involved in cell wall biosynthesis